jgi:ribosomal protein S18 acetylase RimI-like enzyme
MCRESNASLRRDSTPGAVKIRPLQESDYNQLQFAIRLRDIPATRVKYPDWPHADAMHRALSSIHRPDCGCFIVAEEAGRILGFTGCHAQVHEEIHPLLYGPVVDPGHWGKGTGGRLLSELLRHAPSLYGPRRVLTSWADPENAAAESLLNRHGFRPVLNEWFMRLDATNRSPAPLPSDCRVRLSRERADMVLAYEIYRTAWTGRKSVDSFYADFREAPNGLFILEEGGEVVAFFILQHRVNGNADIEYFAVHRDRRGRGLGKVLMQHALRLVELDGRPKAVTLTVHSDNNPAIRLYEGAGFRRMYRMTIYQRRVGG